MVNKIIYRLKQGSKQMSSKKAQKNVTVSSLDEVLKTIIEPVVAALDSHVDDHGKNEANDDSTGHDSPSSRDMGLRIVLSQITQTIHNQLYGAINTKTGNRMPNAKDQLDASEQRLSALQDRLIQGTMTQQDFVTLHWFGVNEARFNMLNELLSSFATVYKHVTNEDWKPYEQKSEVRKIEVDETEKKRLLALLEKAAAKKAAA